MNRRPRGFTIVEMTVAGFLMVVVGVLLARTWTAFGRPAISAIGRARLAQEANLAAESIARDVARLAAPDGPQPDSRYQNATADGSTLTLAIDEGDGVVRTVRYATDSDNPGRLIRSDSAGSRVVAGLVAGFDCRSANLAVGDGDAPVAGVRVDLTLSHRTADRDPDGSPRRDHTRRYTLFIPDARP